MSKCPHQPCCKKNDHCEYPHKSHCSPQGSHCCHEEHMHCHSYTDHDESELLHDSHDSHDCSTHHDLCCDHDTDDIVLFQDLLQLLISIRDQTQEAHWCVGGAHFSNWHEMYEKHYHELNELIDRFVETLLMHHSEISLERSAESIPLKTHCTAGSKKRMSELLEDLVQLIGLMKFCVDTEENIAMADLFTQGIVTLEKQAWFYKNSLMD